MWKATQCRSFLLYALPEKRTKTLTRRYSPDPIVKATDSSEKTADNNITIATDFVTDNNDVTSG